MTDPRLWLIEWPNWCLQPADEKLGDEPTDESKIAFVRAVQADAISSCIDRTRFWLDQLRLYGPGPLRKAEGAAMDELFAQRAKGGE